MKITILTIGEPKLPFAKLGFAEYIKRLGGYHKINVRHLNDAISDEKVLQVIDHAYCVVLDEHGTEFTSRELAKFLNEKSVHGIGEIFFVIGGPDGHSALMKSRAQTLWSMSKLTFPHDMAMIILSEALYRASMINVNHPYHRD